MKCIALLLALAQFNGPALAANSAPPQPNTRPVATQPWRLDPKSGFVAVPNFPHIELVEEDVGTPNKELTKLIEDERLRELVNHNAFFSLQVRNLAVWPRGIVVDGSKVHMPYVVTVKQSLGRETYWNWNHDSINVDGMLTAEFDGSRVRVTVERFEESNYGELIFRALGFNKHVNLAFAQQIAPPQIENWFNENPEGRAFLARLIQSNPVVKP